jgi:hypothetical protein
MDHEPTSSQTAPIRPVWSEAITQMSVKQASSGDRQRDWQDKAATKHKILDLRWAWQGMSAPHLEPTGIVTDTFFSEINEMRPEHGEAFTFRDFEQYLRELDAPFDNFATL